MKKALSLLVVLSMLITSLPIVGAHWADEDVAYLVENGAIAEDDAMLENLDTPITRSQMVKVIVALLDGNEPIEGKEYFTDITAEDTHIAKAAENGFVNGFGDGTFRPNNPITRQDFFTIVGRAYELTGTATSEFTDNDTIADYAKPHIDALQSAGLLNGYGDGTIHPRGNITIAETLAVMHRADEHVKANVPKEEEKPKPKPSGGSSRGGGGGGGFSGPPSQSQPLVEPTQMPSATFNIEYTDDWSSGIVAYVTVELEAVSRLQITKKMLLRYGNYSDGLVGSQHYVWENAERYGQYIAEEDGKFAVPDFGEYRLYVFDSNNDYSAFCFMVEPPASEDTTAPELELEVAGDAKLPLTLKVSASDDSEIARIDYVKCELSAGETYTSTYKLHINGRQSIDGDEFTVTEYAQYIVCVMDTSGNTSYAIFDTNYLESQMDITYSSETIDAIPKENVPSVFGSVSNCAVFTVVREKEFSGENVAYVKADIVPSSNIEKKMLLKDTIYRTGTLYNSVYTRQIAEDTGQYISEKDGVFAIPDFGKYALYVRYGSDSWAVYKFEVKAPISNDNTAPELALELEGEQSFPMTFKVIASDDVGIARINYAELSGIACGDDNEACGVYKIHVKDRKIITDNSFIMTKSGGFVICAMDVNGNLTSLTISVDGQGYGYISDSESCISNNAVANDENSSENEPEEDNVTPNP